jgi:hypothetical protein
LCAAPPPIGLTAAGLFAGEEVSSADLRVRSPGTLTCARCPAARSALDAVPEAYHNPAAVWWGAFAVSAVIRDQVAIVNKSLVPSANSAVDRITSLEGSDLGQPISAPTG